MLESTFQHIQGIGETTEQTLWRMGCTSWSKLLKDDFGMPLPTYRKLKAGVLESKCRLEDLDHRYFRQRLRGALTWRAYNNFRKQACYIDIETTGLSPTYDEVTTVCVHTRGSTKSYVAGENLSELKKDLDEFKYIVSFNGARFDLPFLSHKKNIVFKQIHLDLMYPLRNLGYRGGLKAIEKELGINRETDGVTGYDAVRLWKAYEANTEVEVAGQKVKGKSALRLLVKYNREDTVNLRKLADLTVEKLIAEKKKLFK